MKEKHPSPEKPQAPRSIYDAIKVSEKYVSKLEKEGKPWKKIESIEVNQKDMDKKGKFVLHVLLKKEPRHREKRKLDKEFRGVPIVYNAEKSTSRLTLKNIFSRKK